VLIHLQTIGPSVLRSTFQFYVFGHGHLALRSIPRRFFVHCTTARRTTTYPVSHSHASHSLHSHYSQSLISRLKRNSLSSPPSPNIITTPYQPRRQIFAIIIYIYISGRAVKLWFFQTRHLSHPVNSRTAIAVGEYK